MSVSPARSRAPRIATALSGITALAAIAAVAPIDQTPTPATTVAQGPTSTPVASTPTSPPLSERLLMATSDDVLEVRAAAAAEVRPAAEPAPVEPVRTVWDALADCESGDWLGDGQFVTASADWTSTVGYFEGGLQFDPRTWDHFRDADMPAAAYEATREQQIAVGERVLAAQGWQAWPVCSRKLGLR